MTIDSLINVLGGLLLAAVLICSYHAVQYYRARRRLKELIAVNQRTAATLDAAQQDVIRQLDTLKRHFPGVEQ